MTSTTLRINGQAFILQQTQDLGALKESILLAAESGLGFVDFIAAGHGEVSVLITPRVDIRFEVLDTVPSHEDDGRGDALMVDYDAYAL